MRNLLFTTSIVFLSFFTFGQAIKGASSTSNNLIVNDSWKFPEIENYTGTFQFVVIEKKDFLISQETLDLIENSRKQNDETLISLSPYLHVLIPSASSIENASFVPFSQVYILKP